MTQRFFSTIGLFILGAVLASCSNKSDIYQERPAEELYNYALDVMEGEKYLEAARRFDEVERQHPYSYWATKAQLMAAYSYYKARAYEKAIEALDTFIQLHPGHEDIAYAYYLKGFCYYQQLSIVERDQKMTEMALEALSEIVRRFPHSPYARDSKLKIQLTKDHLAGKNMQVGRFYEQNRLYIAALGRFNTVIDNYQGTTHVPEALHRAVECYLALGLYEEAKRAASVLGHNYPGSDWYEDTYGMLAHFLFPEGAKVPETSLTEGLQKPDPSHEEPETEGALLSADGTPAVVQHNELTAHQRRLLKRRQKKQGKIVLQLGKLDSDPPPSFHLNQRPPRPAPSATGIDQGLPPLPPQTDDD